MKSQMTEQRLATMILSLIKSQGKCLISDHILDELFDLRSERLEALKLLFDPTQERLAAFCTRHGLKMEQSNLRGRTIFTLRS
jgi:hypothetical protein